MQLIPVIDVFGGVVVRAVRGDRANYRPIASGLCRGSDPVAIAKALLDCSRSELLYVADLDALTGQARQAGLISELLDACPRRKVWLDAGFAGLDDWERFASGLGANAARVRPVFASESLQDEAAAREALAGALGAILSLDRKGGHALDPAGCWARPQLWPAVTILMTLDRVGSARGPDLAALAQARVARPDVCFVGAGGIRDRTDLEVAAAGGAWAWLVASALHDRRITFAEHPSDPR